MIALIMAGGSGSRLWPLSRELYPKQLLSVSGGDTLIQSTAKRLFRSIKPSDIHVITNHLHSDNIKQQLGKVDEKMSKNIISEPRGRNTAPAILLSLFILKEKYGEDEIVSVMPADHSITDIIGFNECLKYAEEIAQEEHIVTFGIIPDHAATGYGYIKAGKEFHKKDDKMAAFLVDSFVEKPESAVAEKFLKQGGYYWNGGIFVFKIKTMLDEAKKFMPKLFEKLSNIDHNNISDITHVYNNIEGISIDYGVMERSDNITVLPVEFGWSDVGDFKSMYELSDPKDDLNNAKYGKVATLDCKDSFFYSSGRLIAGIDLEDMVVIDSNDAVLVCPQKSTQKVKALYNSLKEKKNNETMIHRTVYRPWGYYTTLDETSIFKVKRIVVYPGKRLSLQRHFHRSEHWTVVSGIANITIDDKVFTLQANESTYIPQTSIHRMKNPGKIDLHIVEVQVGEYLEEDDIERIEDDFERA